MCVCHIASSNRSINISREKSHSGNRGFLLPPEDHASFPRRRLDAVLSPSCLLASSRISDFYPQLLANYILWEKGVP